MFGEVSVVMPVYNGEEHISEAIESVLNQTYKNLELIIINDGSNDNTFNILCNYKKKDRRVSVIVNNRASGGPALPRNLGIRASNGRFIAFIDHDDVWHYKKLEIQLKFLTDLKLPFISSERINIKSPQRALDFKDINLTTNKYLKISADQLLCNNLINTSSVVIDKKIIQKEEFNQESKYIAVEDYIMWVQLHTKFSHSAKLEIPLIKYRLTNGSISRNKLRMIRRRWSALEVLVGGSLRLRIKYMFFYMLSYIKKKYSN